MARRPSGVTATSVGAVDRLSTATTVGVFVEVSMKLTDSGPAPPRTTARELSFVTAIATALVPLKFLAPWQHGIRSVSPAARRRETAARLRYLAITARPS